MSFDDAITAQVKADRARLGMTVSDLATPQLPYHQIKARLAGITRWRSEDLKTIADRLGYPSTAAFVAAAESSPYCSNWSGKETS